MLVAGARHNHNMKSDVIIQRPHGFREGQNLVILQRSPAYFTLKGQTQLIRENTILILNGSGAQFYMGAGETFCHDWFFFLPEEGDMENWKRWDFPMDTPIHIDDSALFSGIIRDIAYHNTVRSACRRELVNAYVNTFFWHLYDVRQSSCRDQQFQMLSRYEQPLSQLRRHLYEAPAQAPNAVEAAKEMLISRSMFDRIYKSRFQKSYTADLINARIQQAKLLLSSTEMPLAEVAQACGYRDAEHFGRQFRQHTGLPPMRYRRSRD